MGECDPYAMLDAMPSSVLTTWFALNEVRRKEHERARRKGRGKG